MRRRNFCGFDSHCQGAGSQVFPGHGRAGAEAWTCGRTVLDQAQPRGSGRPSEGHVCELAAHWWMQLASLIRMGSEQVLISLGAEGAVGVAGQRCPVCRVRPPSRFEAVWGRETPWWRPWLTPPSRALPFRQAFRMAVAASAATVAMEGTKVADLAAVQELIPQVRLEDVVG